VNLIGGSGLYRTEKWAYIKQIDDILSVYVVIHKGNAKIGYNLVGSAPMGYHINCFSGDTGTQPPSAGRQRGASNTI
jgi:hypothetical protein